MKLCKEMVDAMGGASAAPYRRFRSMACEAYNILRKNAGLILSLVHLMAGASITDVRLDPEKALLKLQVRPGSAYVIVSVCVSMLTVLHRNELP